jgi:hypothetical protein
LIGAGECAEFALKCSDEGSIVRASVAVGDDGHGEGAGVGQDRERDGYVPGDAGERNHLGDSRAEKGNRDIRGRFSEQRGARGMAPGRSSARASRRPAGTRPR